MKLIFKNLFASYAFLVGMILLAGNFTHSSTIWYLYWPVFLFILGGLLLFEYYLKQEQNNLLFFIGSSTVFICLVLFFQNFSNWSYVSNTAWAFPFSIAASSFFAYLQDKNSRYLILSKILLLISIGLILYVYSYYQAMFAIILILVGFWSIRRSPVTK